LRLAFCNKKTPAIGRFFVGTSFVLSAALLFSGWMTSIHFLPWTSWHNEAPVFAAAIVLMGAFIKTSFDCGESQIRVPNIAWPFVLLSAVIVLQTIAERIAFLGDAVMLGFYMVLCIFSLSIGYGVTKLNGLDMLSKSPGPSVLAALLIAGGLFSVFAALVQALDVWDASGWIVPLQHQRRPGGNVAQPNHLATLVLFALASVVYLFETRRLHTVPATLITLVLIWGLSLTESRSGFLSFFLLTGWWLVKRHRAGFKLPLGYAGLWIGLFLCCFWLWPSFFDVIQEPGRGATNSAFVPVNTSAGLRLVVWPQLWAAAWIHPWFGWGLREVSLAHNAVLHLYSVSGAFAYAHNIVLDLAVGVGFPLTALLVVSTLVWLWKRTCAVNDSQTWYCIAVVLPLGVHSMFEYPFAYAYLLVPAMILIGVLEAQLASSNGMRVPRAVMTAIWSVASITMVWSAIEYIAIEEDFRIVRFEALRLGKTPFDYERPNIVMLTQLGALLDAGRIVPTPNMDSRSIELARKVALRFPWPATLSRYALSLALNGNKPEGLRQLDVIRVAYGEETYQTIVNDWTSLADGKYPQLREFLRPEQP
jgi:O-antigen ligase